MGDRVPVIDPIWPGTFVCAPHPSSGAVVVGHPGVCGGEKLSPRDLPRGRARPRRRRDRWSGRALSL